MPSSPSQLATALAGPLLCLAACGPAESDSTRQAGLFDDAAPEAGATVAAKLETPADAPVVVFLGDSFSSGLHLASNQAFPALLQQRLAEQGHAFRLVNAGVSGDTTAGGLRRLDWLLQQQPDILVLELGGNDGLRGQRLHGDQDSPGVYDNLKQIIERSQAAGARVLLLGIVMPPSYGSSYATMFARLYPRLAEEFDLPFVDDFLHEFAGDSRYQLADGLHPNPEGHERLADAVIDELRALLEDVAG